MCYLIKRNQIIYNLYTRALRVNLVLRLIHIAIKRLRRNSKTIQHAFVQRECEDRINTKLQYWSWYMGADFPAEHRCCVVKVTKNKIIKKAFRLFCRLTLQTVGLLQQCFKWKYSLHKRQNNIVFGFMQRCPKVSHQERTSDAGIDRCCSESRVSNGMMRHGIALSPSDRYSTSWEQRVHIRAWE